MGIKIRYKIGSEDVAAFNLQHLKEVPSLKKKQWRGRVILSLVYGLIAIALFVYEPAYWPFSWLLMFFAILWFIFYPGVWEQRVRKKVLKIAEKKEYGVSELDFDEDGIAIKNDDMEGVMSWIHIKKVVQTDQHIFMYLTDEEAIIIPRAGLEDEVDWDELGGYIRSCLVT